MKKTKLIILSATLLAILVGCPFALILPFGPRLDAVYSPYGEVSCDTAAFSPNGKYFAMEHCDEPTINLATYEIANGEEIQKWDLFYNTLKGIAWSPDSKKIAVMYHWDYSTTAVYILELGREGIVAQGWTDDNFYHYMVFSADNQTILLSNDQLFVTAEIVPEETKNEKNEEENDNEIY